MFPVFFKIMTAAITPMKLRVSVCLSIVQKETSVLDAKTAIAFVVVKFAMVRKLNKQVKGLSSPDQ
jgi:hypothetical protein